MMIFGPLIEDNIKKLHGSVEHKGKKSNKTAQHGNDLLDEIAVLNAKLKEAVNWKILKMLPITVMR